MDANVNLNTAECLRSQTNMGETIIHNVCTGTVATVPWGSVDWALFAIVAVFFAGLALLFGSMGWRILTDRY